MSDALFTDLYELTMLAGYHRAGRTAEVASFDLYFRHPPQGVDLVVAAGLDPVLDYLEALAFTTDDIAYLATLGMFDKSFLGWLSHLAFTGDVWAIPEGVPAFGDEPLLRVTAPLGEAQVVETALLNRICYSSLVASNAVQIVHAANGKPVLEFGARRAHGPDGALTGARAAIIGGCAATSNVRAGELFGLEVAGTHAHSWVMAFDSELAAFRAYADAFPDHSVLLVDTYDTLGSGLPNALTVAGELAARGHRLAGIRLDSGDLGALARAARAQLDRAGFSDARIVASGDLDAPAIAALEAAGTPIDSYGVGTSLLTARADPAFAGVYKLAQINDRPVLKISGTPAKTTNPGCKQVWRDSKGDITGDRPGDTIGLADEPAIAAPLLIPAMRSGRRVGPRATMAELAQRCRTETAAVRPAVLAGTWTVARSPQLERLRAKLISDSSPTATS